MCRPLPETWGGGKLREHRPREAKSEVPCRRGRKKVGVGIKGVVKAGQGTLSGREPNERRGGILKGMPILTGGDHSLRRKPFLYGGRRNLRHPSERNVLPRGRKSVSGQKEVRGTG